MDILDLGLLIFILFYIFKNAYLSIVLFALISLILQQFSKNKLLFVLLPLLIAHLFFLYNNPQEGFRRRRWKKSYKKFKKNPIKEIKKYTNPNKIKHEDNKKDEEIAELKAEKSDLETENGALETKNVIEKTKRENEEDIKSEINDKASEHV